MGKMYGGEFRLQVVQRVLAGEKVADVARELGVHRKLVYEWVRRFAEGGEGSLQRGRGRPPKAEGAAMASQNAARRIAELERMVGRQQMAIEFFRLALRRIEELRRGSRVSGATASLKQ